MDPRRHRRLLRTVVNYARFNAGRTLAMDTPSEFAVEKFGNAIALADPARPRAPMYNRVLGMGPGEVEQLAAVLKHYKKLGCQPHFELGVDAIVPELVIELTGRGFEPHDAITYLSTSPASQQPAAPTAVTVERWGHGRADEFRSLLAGSGVSCEDSVWEQRRAHYATDTFRLFVASLEGAPVAWATSYIDGENKACYLANAYTAPEQRGRGCQRVLLGARLTDAVESNIKTALTDVVPDSSSERNTKRSGFKPDFTLTLWRQ